MRVAVCALAFCSLFGIAQPAAATIFDVHYSGIVQSGVDQTGVFGSANRDLSTLDFAADLRFDTSLGSPFVSSGSLADLTTFQPDPVRNLLLSSSLTTSQHSTSFNGLDSSDILEAAVTSDLLTGVFDQATQQGAFDASFLSFQSTAQGLPASFDVAYFGSLTPGGFDSSFQVATDNEMASGVLNATAVTITPEAVSAAPEPETWVLMFAGVAMLGAALRFDRRRQGAALAA